MKILGLILTRSRNVLPDEKLAAARHMVLQNCDFLIDIGANDGSWVMKVQKLGYKNDALCIEPLKTEFEILKSRRLEKTNYINSAIGNKNGFVYINKASNNGLSSSIYDLNFHHKIAAPHIKYIGKEKVKIQKLSEILKKDIHKKIFVKIDTQGYEYEVLKSISKNDFRRIYAFEIETNLVKTYKNSTLVEDLIKFLRLKGFDPLRIENGFGMPNFGQQLQADILFVKKS